MGCNAPLAAGQCRDNVGQYKSEVFMRVSLKIQVCMAYPADAGTTSHRRGTSITHCMSRNAITLADHA